MTGVLNFSMATGWWNNEAIIMQMTEIDRFKSKNIAPGKTKHSTQNPTHQQSWRSQRIPNADFKSDSVTIVHLLLNWQSLVGKHYAGRHNEVAKFERKLWKNQHNRRSLIAPSRIALDRKLVKILWNIEIKVDRIISAMKTRLHHFQPAPLVIFL